MVLWRISRHRDLKGIGGLKAGGRWHYPGQPVVYLSENPASALLEVCVHTAANDVPPEFTLLRIEGHNLQVPSIMETDLPENWQALLDVTQNLGTDWLRENEAVLLKIPSAIVPQTANFLFNPLHVNASLFHIAEALKYPFDFRIKR
jgi:RES domain-containing protein